MIQRKQTLYLLLSAVLIAMMAFFNLAEFVAASASYAFSYKGVYSLAPVALVQETDILGVLVMASVITALVTVFFYKKRPMQMRLCVANIAFMAGMVAFAFYNINAVQKSLNALVVYHWVLVMPFIAIVLQVLAFIAISKDEALVRSVNRIR